MIIYGVKVTPLMSVPLAKEFCPNCNEEGSLVLSIFSQYAYIFLIPTVPVGKTGVTICIHCNQSFEKNDMPNFLRLRYEHEAAATRVPLWTWSGLFIILILFTIFYAIERQ